MYSHDNCVKQPKTGVMGNILQIRHVYMDDALVCVCVRVCVCVCVCVCVVSGQCGVQCHFQAEYRQS